MLKREKLIFIAYSFLGTAIVSAIIFWSYHKLGLLDSNIVLGGWDSPFYLWQARTVLRAGPVYFMNRMTYPMLYPQFLAGVSLLTRNMVWSERILPEIMGGFLIAIYSIFTYRISHNIHIAGVTSILTGLSPGFLWVVGEYHRTNLALIFAWLGFLCVTDRYWTKSYRKVLTMVSLLFLAAFTEFEVFVVMSLTIIGYSVFTMNRKSFAISLALSLLPIFAIIAPYPQYFSIHYLNLESESYVIQRPWIYSDLIFWGIGTIGILPVVMLGAFALAKSARREFSPESLIVIIFTLILIVPAVAISQTTLNGLGIRAFLVAPFSVLIALGVGFATSWYGSLSRLGPLSNRILVAITGIQRRALIGIALSVLVATTLGVSSIEASNIEMVPFFQVSGYSKVLQADQYLRSNHLSVPIYVFAGSSLWSADEYRAYIGADLGDHLAYFGDMSNLFDFRPTWSNLPYPAGNIANFTSLKYLRDLMGDRGYLIYFQSESVRTYAQLLERPVVFVTPEIYDAPVPFYARQFDIGNGVYVIPSLALVASEAAPSMTLQSQNGTQVVYGYVNGSTVTVNLGSGSSYYNLTQFPTYLKPLEFLQGGSINYPEYEPRRPSGQSATSANDVADNIQNWQSLEASFAVDSSYQKDGNASLLATGNTDAWGNLWASYHLPVPVNMSSSDSISFWGSVDENRAQWVVVLQDSSGVQASYWNNLGSPVNPNTVGLWGRVMTNLKSPTSMGTGFNFSSVVSISIVIALTTAHAPLSFHVDDLILDSQLPPNQMFESRVNSSEQAEAVFLAN